MNAHVPTPAAVTATSAWFAALCDNRARLYAEGVLELHEAVDELQGYARLSGLIDHIGQDEAQHIVALAIVVAPSLVPDIECELCGRTIEQHHQVDTDDGPELFCDDLEALIRRRAIELEREFWCVVRLDDPEYLKRWFAQHPLDVPALLKLYERKNAIA